MVEAVDVGKGVRCGLWKIAASSRAVRWFEQQVCNSNDDGLKWYKQWHGKQKGDRYWHQKSLLMAGSAEALIIVKMKGWSY